MTKYLGGRGMTAERDDGSLVVAEFQSTMVRKTWQSGSDRDCRSMCQSLFTSQQTRKQSRRQKVDRTDTFP